MNQEIEREEMSDEVIEQAFNDWLDDNLIDGDTSAMDDEDRASFNKCKRRVCLGIKKGHVSFTDKGEIQYTPQRSPKVTDTLTFHERSGADTMAADGHKKNQDIAKTYAVMGAMCKVHKSTFAKLVGADCKMVEAIFALLMD